MNIENTFSLTASNEDGRWYFCNGGWIQDSRCALRFSKEDAEKLREYLRNRPHENSDAPGYYGIYITCVGLGVHTADEIIADYEESDKLFAQFGSDHGEFDVGDIPDDERREREQHQKEREEAIEEGRIPAPKRRALETSILNTKLPHDPRD